MASAMIWTRRGEKWRVLERQNSSAPLQDQVGIRTVSKPSDPHVWHEICSQRRYRCVVKIGRRDFVFGSKSNEAHRHPLTCCPPPKRPEKARLSMHSMAQIRSSFVTTLPAPSGQRATRFCACHTPKASKERLDVSADRWSKEGCNGTLER